MRNALATFINTSVEASTVWVDRELPFDNGVSYDPPKGAADRAPTWNDLEPVSIGGRGNASLSVHHLKLWRDTYYTVQADSDKDFDREGTDFWSTPSLWNQYSLEAMTMYVQPGHYLCMGDNSPASSDSRTWDKENLATGIGGLVPERLMLGRALLVYFPFYRAGPIK